MHATSLFLYFRIAILYHITPQIGIPVIAPKQTNVQNHCQKYTHHPDLLKAVQKKRAFTFSLQVLKSADYIPPFPRSRPLIQAFKKVWIAQQCVLFRMQAEEARRPGAVSAPHHAERLNFCHFIPFPEQPQQKKSLLLSAALRLLLLSFAPLTRLLTLPSCPFPYIPRIFPEILHSPPSFDAFSLPSPPFTRLFPLSPRPSPIFCSFSTHFFLFPAPSPAFFGYFPHASTYFFTYFPRPYPYFHASFPNFCV